MASLYSTFSCGPIAIRYLLDESTGQIGLELIPAGLEAQLATPRTAQPWDVYDASCADAVLEPARTVDPLVQIKFAHDAYSGGFAQGHTMQRSPSTAQFRFAGQTHESHRSHHSVVSRLQHPLDLELEHRLEWQDGDETLQVQTTIRNRGLTAVSLEMLSSFSLGNLSPFCPDDAPGRMVLHRFRSGWSAEGRLESRSLEELHLERSWSGSAVRTERFGQVGSLPVRQWFPLAAVEDQVVGVTWAAQLEWPGSWQMEVHRRYDNVALTGGLADREFGHWQKALVPGETLRAPLAILTCVEGDVDAACARLVQRLERLADEQPAVEQDLPITFNEFCTTWGDPQHDKVVRIARHLKGTPVRYFVIDAGWYKRPDATWANGHGDWQPSAALFPKGIEATAEAIRRQGLIPGLWFEAETCGEHSTAFSLIDHLLKRDGIPITAKGRRFWDLNDPWVRDYLSEKIIGLLERGSFGYVKIDYNETIGIGCDGAESQGEGLRQHLLGTWQLFDQLRERLPELVIENCASGGHRLEPSIVRRTAMSSFSDAHESLEIPIIGAALHRLIPPRQSLIWAVLRANDSRRRICYSLAAGFLGRLCLSGDIDQLSDEQGQLLRHGLDLYTQVTPVIKSGRSQLVSQHGLSWRYPKGWQAVLRESDGQLLVVVHTFAAAPDEIRLPLPGDRPWRVVGELTDAGAASVEQAGRVLHCPAAADFSGRVVWLKAG